MSLPSPALHASLLGRRAAGANPLVHLLLLLGIASGAQAASVPTIGEQASAPDHLRAFIAEQNDLASRRAFTGIRLLRRSLTPTPGIEPGLATRAASDSEALLVVAQLDRFPSHAQWQQWATHGVDHVDYLANRFWLISVAGDLSQAFALIQAVSFTSYLAPDKVAPALDFFTGRPDFFDEADGLVVLDLTLIDAHPIRHGSVRDRFHRTGKSFVDNSGGRLLTIVTEPSNIPHLAAQDSVLLVVPGAWQGELLLDGVRTVVHADHVLGADGFLLTGAGIRMANNELMGSGSGHEDFFDHDAAGNPTTPRWTPLAEQQCITSIQRPFIQSHAQMTAGIMLGNGWQSEANGGAPLAFRGMAPRATYECYDRNSARAHVSSHSYVGTELTTNTIWDAATVGDLSIQRFHAHVAAAGNSGVAPPFYSPEAGYFSILNNSKNTLVVANAQVNQHIHPTSSSGPTHDGRIKPDIAAPTTNFRPDLDNGFEVEIETITLLRDDSSLYSWTFDSHSPAWHQGWGHTDNVGLFGQVFLDVRQTSAGNMLIDVAPKPWGEQWRLSPVVGTQVVPTNHPTAAGEPLDFVGAAGDVLEIHYRAVSQSLAAPLGYFDLKPVWLRAFPPMNSSDWYSQGAHGAIGIGDGQWRTIQIPVGHAQDIFVKGNPFWPDVETWSGFDIQYLGLRFNQTDFQPTTTFPQYYQGTSGTSGASPVAAGAYALAMEHLTTLYRRVDLDDKQRRSVFFTHAQPPYGMPFNSTWKGLFVHTARDLTDAQPGPGVVAQPPNPDTGVPTSYYAGPDYTTGYGMLDAQSGVDLLTHVAAGEPLYALVEQSIISGQYHTYAITVSDAFASGSKGLKITLAWDDPPAYGSTSEIEPKLVNNLGLVLQDPAGNLHEPWSLDIPYAYDETNGPHMVEPEPIDDDDIVPARRDLPNDRDNLEQVQVDNLAPSQTGTWLVHVVDNGMGSPALSGQPYSLIVSPWNVSEQCHACE